VIELPHRAPSGNPSLNHQITRSPDSRVGPAIGRVARLELAFERRAGRTVLAHGYAEPPFRIGHTFDLDGAAYVIVVCSGPGVFAGDALRQSVHVGRGARVVLASQSALQAHPSPAANAASILHEYDIEDEAELHCHWDPLIPFAWARIDQRVHLRVAAGGRLYWSDALMAGRAARGETWRFTELAHEVQVRTDSRCAYLERYRLEPANRHITERWSAGNAAYCSTVLVWHARADPDAAACLQRSVTEIRAVTGAADMVEPGLIVARLAARAGPPFAAARSALRAAALETIFGISHLVVRK